MHLGCKNVTSGIAEAFLGVFKQLFSNNIETLYVMALIMVPLDLDK